MKYLLILGDFQNFYLCLFKTIYMDIRLFFRKFVFFFFFLIKLQKIQDCFKRLELQICTTPSDFCDWFTREIFVGRSWFCAEDFHSGCGRGGMKGAATCPKRIYDRQKRALAEFRHRGQPTVRSDERVGPFDFVLVARFQLLSMPGSCCEKSTRYTKIKITIFDDLLGRRKKESA